jgi:hypothetical protein
LTYPHLEPPSKYVYILCEVLQYILSSSYSAAVNIAMGITKSIVIDMAFCLQGNEDEELPEVLLGSCRFTHVDVKSAIRYPISSSTQI